MAAATMYVTPAGAGAKNGTNWANAFDLAAWENDVENNAEAGDVYYVKAGTYTLTGDFNTALDGSGALPIQIIGVKAATTNEPPIASDEGSGADRPLIAAGANDFIFDNQWQMRNLEVTTTDATGFEVGFGCWRKNCKVTNSSGVANRAAFNANQASSLLENCEGISTAGRAVNVAVGDYNIVLGCYLHDSDVGVYTAAHTFIFFSIIDTCTTYGIRTDGHSITLNNTIYNCGTGITENGSYPGMSFNNIIDTCTTGASATTTQPINQWDYNNWNNNTADVSNVTKGPNATAYDPKFTDAPGGDFSLESDSECIGAGFSIGLGVG